MYSDGEIDKNADQLRAYRREDQLTDILDKYSSLLKEYRRLKSDYEEERDAREKYKQVAKSQERNPFVLVLIDGDGYVFNENFFGEAGGAGGANAAQALNDAIKASLRGKGLEHCQVMVRIYANVAGLSKAMNKGGGHVGAEKRSLGPFIANFNRSYGLTDFVDAGELKENADFKIRALLNLYAENAQCKHIYFAACHDVAYISDLTPHMGNSDRFTLIDAPCIRFHDEFAKLQMKRETLPGVFRSNVLGGAAPYRPSDTTAMPPPSAPTVPKSQSIPNTPQGPSQPGLVCRFPRSKCKFGSSCRYPYHPGDPPRDTPSSSNNNWRESPLHEGNQQHNGSSPMISLDYSLLPQKGTVPEGHVAVNKYDHRLDEYIPPPSASTMSQLSQITRRSPVCNDFQLAGFCKNGNNCSYDHSPLDEKYKVALESLARSMTCKDRGECRNSACTKGHICQVPDCKVRGGRAFCRLPFKAHIDELKVSRYIPCERPAQARTASSTIVRDSTRSSSTAESTPEGTSLIPDRDDNDGASYMSSSDADYFHSVPVESPRERSPLPRRERSPLPRRERSPLPR